ncbi:MAG TPA: GspH/FimT family pseudopilin [Stellaceae bacterium]|nr:GspH/FimT family pseudopilin [Stellaceae bacterium]
MRASGFTLVEMLVVLVVLALVAALVPPLLAGGRDRLELAATTREIAAALRETRSLAIREGRSEAFVLDGAGLFRAGAGPVRRLPAGLLLSITGVADGRARAAIRFFADGSSTGGHLILLRGERRSDVTVDWLTGRVALDAAAR